MVYWFCLCGLLMKMAMAMAMVSCNVAEGEAGCVRFPRFVWGCATMAYSQRANGGRLLYEKVTS